MKLKFTLFTGILFLIIAFADTGLACSCLAKPSVLESFESSESVMIAKVLSVEMTEEAKGVDFTAMKKKAGYDRSHEYVKSTKMVVEKVYKGNLKVGEEVTFGQGGGADCIWTFGIDAVGESFLFYVGAPGKNHPWIDDINFSQTPMYYAVTCGRSRGIGGYEADDLKYLNNIEKVKGKTRISGDFNCWYQGCPNFANLKIKIIGEKKTFQTQTDANGVYEIYDLPPGSYLLEPEVPKGWKINPRMLEYSPAFRQREYLFYGDEQDFSKRVPIVLEAGKHTGIDFYFDMDTAIRGKVLSPDGKPLKGVCVTAVSTQLEEGDYRGRSDCTNEEGVFLIEEMPPNKYILIANDDGKISAKEPFGITFYPNVTDYKNAKPIEVKLGDRFDGFIIRIPKFEELITVSGKLLYSNDVPVAEESIKLDAAENFKNVDDDYIKTDKDGNFSFKILKGFQGKLFGKMYVYESKFKNCPQAFAEIKKRLDGKYSTDLISPKIPIDATKNASNLIVKFDFQGCEKE